MSKEQNLDEGYFEWLYSLVAPLRNPNPGRTYFLLAEQMMKTDFEWSVPNDDNRIEDGKELRREFLGSFEAPEDWMSRPCSVLEMMVALGRHVAFESHGGADEWFWQLCKNLGLREFTDDVYDDRAADEVDDILNVMIHRKYNSEGHGGLFPLDNCMVDQREIEIWYQMSTYLLEGGEGP